MLISFSGLDGSGKSTLIEWLSLKLKEKNYRVTTLTMYYHLSFYALIRAVRDRIKKKIGIKEEQQKRPTNTLVVLNNPNLRESGSEVNLRDPKIGACDKKGFILKIIYYIVRSRILKQVSLFFDLLILSIFRLYYEKLKKRIIITDRYLYDTLADVADLQGRRWLFIRLYLLISPTPDLPVFIDVTPEEAYARKGEYPVEYMNWRRDTYLKIFNWVRGSVIIVNNDLNTAKKILETSVMKMLNKP